MPEELWPYVYRTFPKYVDFDDVQFVLSGLNLKVNARLPAIMRFIEAQHNINI
jgi:hypothetical protein